MAMIRTVFSLLIYSAVLFYTALPQAVAQNTELESLKSFFQSYLDRQEAYFAANGIKLTQEGSLQVEQANGFFAVTTPFLTMTYPDGVTLHFGIFSANVAQAPDPDFWAMRLAMPANFSISQNGDDLLTITLSDQRSSLLVHKETAFISQHNFSLDNIALNVPQAATPLMTIGKLQLSQNYQNIDFTAVKTGLEKTQAIIEATESGSEQAEIETLFDLIFPGIAAQHNFYAYLSDIENDFTQKLPEALERFGSLHVTDNDGQPLNTDQVPEILQMNIAELVMEKSSSDSGNDRSAMRINASISGMEASPATNATPEVQNFVTQWPSGITLSFALNNIPKNSLIAFLQEAEMSRRASDNAVNIEPNFPAMLQILAESGATLALQYDLLRKDSYQINNNLNARASLTSPFGAEGTSTTRLYGFNQLLAILQETGYGSLDQIDPALIETVLTLLDATVQDEGAEPYIRIRFEADQNGALTLNGKPIQMLMQVILPQIMQSLPQQQSKPGA